MVNILQYTPGQVATIFLQLTDEYGARTNDGYVPVVQQVINPQFTTECDYPKNMTQLDNGLFYFQFCIPNGACAVGSYLIDVAYLAADGYVNNEIYQLVITAPYGNFGTTHGYLHNQCYPYEDHEGHHFSHEEDHFEPHPEPFYPHHRYWRGK